MHHICISWIHQVDVRPNLIIWFHEFEAQMRFLFVYDCLSIWNEQKNRGHRFFFSAINQKNVLNLTKSKFRHKFAFKHCVCRRQRLRWHIFVCTPRFMLCLWKSNSITNRTACESRWLRAIGRAVVGNNLTVIAKHFHWISNTELIKIGLLFYVT